MIAIIKLMRKNAVFLLAVVFVFLLFLFLTSIGRAEAQSEASIFLAPAGGTFAIGSTFNVTVAINTGGKAINAFKVKLLFPPDKLQVVSSGTGQSIAGLWIIRPSFSNIDGIVELQGAIPSPGINTDYGVITTLTFRAKSLGQAIIRVDQSSGAYLNDGKGSDANAVLRNGIYNLVLPPPAGPLVVSSSHPDQDKWYNVNDVILEWTIDPGVEGFSYVLNDDPVAVPDNISEGKNAGVTYKSLSDGIHYFHIKAMRGGAWGGVTHYGIKVQTSGPAEFKIDILPGKRTSSKNVTVLFNTTDTLSGLDHYEMKIIPLTSPATKARINAKAQIASQEKTEQISLVQTPLFFEVTSPYLLEFSDYGAWDIIVRAYNKAGNYTETTEKLRIVKPFFEFINSTGVNVGGLALPWFIFWPIAAVIIAALAYLAYHTFRWHVHINLRHQEGALKDRRVSAKLEELRERFNLLKVLALLLTSGIIIYLLQAAAVAKAGITDGQNLPSAQVQLPPPTANLVSKNINNNELFYVGGRAASGNNGKVIVYLQNLSTGETYSFETEVSPNGDWFYSHNKFLQSGNYLLWTQLKIGDNVSPPSGQIQMVVSPVAIQLGASRLSYETIYLALMMLFLAIVIGLSGFIIYHFRHGHRKKKNLMKEIKEAEESIKRGFAVLKHDIQAELETIKKIKMAKELSEEEKMKETQLLRDLEEINASIGKEVWDIEREAEAESI